MGSETSSTCMLSAGRKKFFKPPEELAALSLEDISDCTAWELMQILWFKGWDTQRGPSTVKARRSLPAITPGSGRKVFYAPSLNMCGKQSVAYLKALCYSEALFAEGFVQAIHHGQNETYYLSIMDREHNGELPEDVGQIADAAPGLPELEMDVDEHMRPQNRSFRPADPAPDPLEKLLALPEQQSHMEFFGLQSDEDVEASSSEGFLDEGSGSDQPPRRAASVSL